MPTPEELGAVARANNAFAFALWKQVHQPGNLAVSPVSIAAALVMAWSGARGTTASELGAALHLDGDPARVAQQWGTLEVALENPARQKELRIANRLFGEKTFAFDRGYLDLTERAYGAPLEPVDFRGAPEAARQRIDGWIADATRDHIRELLPPGSIDDSARLVIANAIYFLADWATPFTHESTVDVPFAELPQPARVPTMNEVSTLRYAAMPGYAIVELPYRSKVAMLVALPDAADGLPALEGALDDAAFAKAWAALAPRQVAVSLPRFTIDPASPIDLKSALRGIGVQAAFGPGADFSGIANPAATGEQLSISNVFHKAFVKTDETGTEAAAATAVVAVETASARAPAPPPIVFRADHPFLFFVVDRDSSLVLFMGRVTAP